MNKKQKILITGGHITPAIAVADELHARLPEAEIVFIGRKIALEGSRLPSEEGQIVKDRGFRFLAVTAGRLTRTLTPFALLGILLIPIGFLEAFRHLLRERPSVIVSFGGYVALPVVLVGWILGIPVVTHEQTRIPGLANRIIGLFAKTICVSFPETKRWFRASKTIVTGLPIRKIIIHPPKTAPFILDQKKPLILIAGGSTGARSINRLVFPIIPDLVRAYTVIHQTGRIDITKAPDVEGYWASAFLDEPSYSWALHHASLIVARSGANTVGEVAATGKVALFIPLPWSGGNEQYHNARALADSGSAKIAIQENLTSEQLREEIEFMEKNLERFAESASILAKTIPRSSAALVADRVIALIPNA